jgi:hypothetical protein
LVYIFQNIHNLLINPVHPFSVLAARLSYSGKSQHEVHVTSILGKGMSVVINLISSDGFGLRGANSGSQVLFAAYCCCGQVGTSIPFAALILAVGVESSSLYMDRWIKVFMLSWCTSFHLSVIMSLIAFPPLPKRLA